MSDRIVLLVNDGGGIRGAWQMRLYAEIEARLGAPIRQIVGRGMIAGTSAGGINAALLVHPAKFSASDGLQFYLDEGAAIFHRNWWDPSALLDPKFSDNGLAEALHRRLGETRIDEAVCKVFITAWDFAASKPYYYTNANAMEPDLTALWMACRATAAVPAYFRPWGARVDGGVYGSNPTLWALAQARRTYGRDAKFLILSVGTGAAAPKPIDPNAARNWGELSWALPAIGMLAEANPIVTEIEMPWLVGPEDLFFRWQAPIPALLDPHFDNGSKQNIESLIKFQGEVIASRPAEIAAICDALAAAKE